MNAGELKTALKRFGFDDSDPLLTWLNAAMHQFEDEYDWIFTEKMTSVLVAAGAKIFSAYPTDLVRPLSIMCTSPSYEDPLMPLGHRDYQSKRAGDGGEISGVPTHFVRQGSAAAPIVVYPLSDVQRSYEFVYRARSVDLSVDGDVPALIPLEFHYGLVEGAAAIALGAESNEDRGVAHKDAFNEWIARAAGKYLKRIEGGLDQVREVQDY